MKYNRTREIEEIKSIHPDIVIADLGIQCRKRTSYYECHAVWRGDMHPSLSLFPHGNQWRWRDHGTGESGSWIDLYMRARNMTYSEAVRYLRELIHADFPSQPYGEYTHEKEDVHVIHTEPLSGHPLSRVVMKDRHFSCIPQWVEYVEWEMTGRKYFGYGVRDIHGVFHVRYVRRKPGVAKELTLGRDSTYSLFPSGSGAETVYVCEGMIDGVRVYELICMNILRDGDILALNGVENYHRAVSSIRRYENIYLVLDRDTAGIRVAQLIREAILNQSIYDVRWDGEAKDLDEAVLRGLYIYVA